MRLVSSDVELPWIGRRVRRRRARCSACVGEGEGPAEERAEHGVVAGGGVVEGSVGYGYEGPEVAGVEESWVMTLSSWPVCGGGWEAVPWAATWG
jgi:hypothetical protein